MTIEQAPASEQPNDTQHVVVYVTRGANQDQVLELLVYENDGDLTTHAPMGRVLPGEHLAEAALRCATDMTGYDVFFTFRKLATVASEMGTVHYFQTSPEVDLPDEFSRHHPSTGTPHRFVWLRQGDLTRRLPSAERGGLQRIFDEAP